MGGKLTPEELEVEGLGVGASKKLTPEELAAEGLSTVAKPDVPFFESDSMWNPLPSKETRERRRKEAESLAPQATARIRSALNSATYGFAPSIVGMFESDDEAAATKKTYADAIKAHPTANKVGVLFAPFPGTGLLRGPAKYLAQSGIGAATSGAQAYNASHAESVTDKLSDAVLPAAIGAVAAPVAGAISSGVGRLVSKLRGGSQKIMAETLAKDIETMRASASGRYGAAVQDANRAMLNIKEIANNPNANGLLRRNADEFLSSPEGVALAEQVGKNTLERVGDKMPAMAALKDKLAQVPAEAAAKNAAYFGQNALSPRGSVGSRVSRYVSAGLGGVVGGTAGQALEDVGLVPESYGKAVGAAMGASLGRPGGSMANLFLRNPQFAVQWRNVMARALESGGAALARFGHTGAQLAAIGSAKERAEAAEQLAGTPEGAADFVNGLELEKANKLRARFGGKQQSTQGKVTE